MKKFFTLITAGALLFAFSSCGSKGTESAETEYIYGQIESISGNDVTLLLAEYNENAETDKDSEDSEDSESKEKSGNSKIFSPPDGFDGEMPEGFDKEKFEGFTRPDGESGSKDSKIFSPPDGFDGEMPEGFDKEKFEGFTRPDDESGSKDSKGFTPPDGFDKEKFEGRSKEDFKSFSSENQQYTLTGEQEEFQIPVGTEVTTSLGVKTDFEVLKAGDIVKCTVEQDKDNNQVITAVWIVEV